MRRERHEWFECGDELPGLRRGGGAGLRSAQIFGAGEFVSGVVDDFIGLKARRGIGAEPCDLTRDDHQNKKQEGLQKK